MAATPSGAKTHTPSGSATATSTWQKSISWQRHQVGLIYPTVAVASSDGSGIVVAGYPGNLFSSADSGAGWANSYQQLHIDGLASSSSTAGLIAYSNSAGYNDVSTSSDGGATWGISLAYNDTGEAQTWSGVASSSNGTRLVAVSRYSNATEPGYLFTSADSGASWSYNESLRNSWRAVASSSDGTRLIACTDLNGVYYGRIYLSADSGESWQAVGDPTMARTWVAVASSSNGTVLAAISATSGNFQVTLSTDSGSTWGRGTSLGWSPQADVVPPLALSGDGTTVLAVGGQQHDTVYMSWNTGATWRAGVPFDSSITALALSRNGSFSVATDGFLVVYTGTWTSPPTGGG